MRRLPFFVIASALTLAGGTNLLLAQHHQGGGHVGHASVTRSQPASASLNTLQPGRYPSAGQTIYPTPIGLQGYYSGYSGINRGVLTNNGSRRGSRGVVAGYAGGVLFPPYYYSTFADDYGAPYPYIDPVQDQASQTANATANLLGEQVQRLSSEVESLRLERQQSTNPDPQPAPQPEEPAQPPVTLILKNGKQLQLKSYAVMGQTIWDFSSQPSKRIPLANVNLEASKSATEAAGAEFPDLR